MDAETLAVLVTFAIDVGVAILICLGFLVYRRCRGDNIVKRSSGHV